METKHVTVKWFVGDIIADARDHEITSAITPEYIVRHEVPLPIISCVKLQQNARNSGIKDLRAHTTVPLMTLKEV